MTQKLEEKIFPIVMAGGSGTRLWPLSRSHYPKQFIDLVGKQTMLQQTIRRLDGMDMLAPCIICNETHRFLVAEQLRSESIPHSGIILEPVGRNSAPAIALAALKAIEDGKNPLLLVLAADHAFVDVSAFQQAVINGVKIAQQDKLVTFGIVPTEPHIGYGYIKKGESFNEHSFNVDTFEEKPSLDKAQSYFTSCDYMWNSGMFLFKAERYLQELEHFAPDILQQCQLALKNAKEDLEFTRLDKKSFEQCRDESIDYAVMEHTKDAVVVAMDAGWNDVGSWASLWEISEKDEANNVIQGDVIPIDTKGSLIRGGERLIATLGINDLVIIDTKDALMVAHKDHLQNVKQIVDDLKTAGRSEYQNHREVYRPWGMYDSIDVGKRFQVKRITVTPGSELSLQKHHHRAEHWVVVSGTAEVTCGDKVFLLTENQSTYIPLGEVHRLANRGKVLLEIIEVQSGAYLGEDDIVRFDDKYGRSDIK